MKNIIICSNNDVHIKDVKNNYIKVFYKEGILEILEQRRDIDIIYIFENTEGIINNRELILKIKKYNKKIDIIYILEKTNLEKEKNLNKIGIKKIYIKQKNKEIKNKTYLIKDKINEKDLNNLLEYLNKKNKKILIINKNNIRHNKIENKNIRIINKNINYNKYKKIYNYIFLLNSKEINKEEIKNVDKIILKMNKENIIETIKKINKYNKKEKIIILKKRNIINNRLLKEIVGNKIKIINFNKLIK